MQLDIGVYLRTISSLAGLTTLFLSTLVPFLDTTRTMAPALSFLRVNARPRASNDEIVPVQRFYQLSCSECGYKKDMFIPLISYRFDEEKGVL